MWKALAVATMIGVGAVTAHAQTPQDRIVELLLDQGFQEIRVTRTLLGRTRIVAENDRLRREIVLNPSTGVILRDFLRVIRKRGDDDDDDAWGILGGYEDDDDDDYEDDPDDEDDRDDDDKEDNSGPSDNSGSGSNSGSGGGDDSDADDPDD